MANIWFLLCGDGGGGGFNMYTHRLHGTQKKQLKWNQTYRLPLPFFHV